MKYVIERQTDGVREWWTGSEWSDVDTDAEWYTTSNAAEYEAAEVGGTPTGFEV